MIETAWNFLREHWTSGIEILIIAIVLYWIYIYLRGTRGARMLIGIAVALLTLVFITQLLNLVVISWILRNGAALLALALVVVFQPELRRALTELGSHYFLRSAFQEKETLEELVDTVFELASKGFGALIAIEREITLRQLADTGVDIDCRFSKELVVTIFHPKTLLHDGGLILRNDRIVSAACIFPLTQREDLDRNLGLRHRAALGLTEESDAITVVVSEETGQVAVCHDGTIERNLNVDKFRRRLNQLLLLEKYEKSDSDELED